MRTKPLITTVVTTYDRPLQVKTAIRSVLGQTYGHTELLVVEDGTETGTDKWLDKHGKNRARYIRHETNKGLAAARNTGIREAQGTHIAFLDDDDEWKPRRLERQIDLLSSLSPEERNRLGVIYCPVETRYTDHVHIGTADGLNQGNLRRAILEQGKLTITPSSGLFAAEALREVGGFDETLASSIDHDIWMSLAYEGYHAYVVEEALVVNDKQGEASMVTNTSQRIRGIRQFVEKWEPVFQEWLGLEDGRRFVRRYFTRVLGKLLQDQVANGDWQSSLRSLRTIIRESSDHLYTLLVILWRLVGGVLERLPPSVQQTVRVLRGRLSTAGDSMDGNMSQ